MTPTTQRMYTSTRRSTSVLFPLEVHEHQIGGYQVCDKWLKDRKERRLNLDDIRTYCRMVTAIGLTLAIQQELDTVYADVENNLIPIEAK